MAKLQTDEVNGVQCLLRDDIWEYIQKRGYGKQVLKDDKLHNYPSELFSCKRKVYYGWTGAPKNTAIDYSGMRTMDMGTLLHPYFGQLWSRAGFFLNEECHAGAKEFNVSFRPDFIGIIRNKKIGNMFHMKIGQIFVIDFKTTSNRAYEYAVRGARGLPKLDDEMQLQFYIGQLREYLGKDMCPYGFLQYSSRDWARKFWNGKWMQQSLWKHDVALFQIPANPKKYELGKEYFTEIAGFVKKKKIPPKEGNTAGKYPCAYCWYSDYCWRRKE